VELQQQHLLHQQLQLRLQQAAVVVARPQLPLKQVAVEARYLQAVVEEQANFLQAVVEG
jgi:hypothetical protein